jgi:hypothetical protein
MANSVLLRCCDPSVSTIYESWCNGSGYPDCLTGNVYKISIDGIESPFCWETISYTQGSVFANIVALEGPYESCNECTKNAYKLVNCYNNEVVYTDYINCPDCINYINQLAYTDLEPNPCWYVTVTDEIEPSIPIITYTCDVTADAADDTYMNFKISINGIEYAMGNLWNQVSYTQLETDLNALTVGGQPLGQFTVAGEPYDNAVGRITVVGTNSYDYIVLDYGSPFNVLFTCTSVITPAPPGQIVPVIIFNEGFCPNCEPKCYTITGTGNISYFNVYQELITDLPAPAVICSISYPTVAGIGYQIFINENDCDYRQPCPVYCYDLTNCVTQEVIVTTNQDLAFPYVLGQTIEIANRDGCWTISRRLAETCIGAIDTTITVTHADCTACLPPLYYRLESCGNSDPVIIYTSQDLSAYVGQTITLDNYIGCYNVTIYNGQVPSPVTVTFKQNYPDCIQCALPRYKLTDCDGIRNSIYTTTDLSSYLSSVIKLTFYPDTCWTVTTTTINSSDDLVIVDSEYASCEICTTNTVCFCSAITNNSTTTQSFQFEDCDNNIQTITVNANTLSREYCILRWIYPIGWNLPKIYSNNGACINGKCPSGLSFRSIRPGYNSPACSEQYYEKIACRYADILYKDVISKRYGIAPACEQDDIYRLHIKFQLLEMQAINNPDYICNPSGSCCQEDTNCGCGCNNSSPCQQTINCGCGCNS